MPEMEIGEYIKNSPVIEDERTFLSAKLEEMFETLGHGEQVILFKKSKGICTNTECTYLWSCRLMSKDWRRRLT